MHVEAFAFLERCAYGRGGTPPIGEKRRVLELGSLDVNGSPREVFPAPHYVGIDLVPGDGVDIVTDAAYWASDERFDLVVCTEVLEHEPKWPLLIATAALHLEPGGHLIVTAASEGRAPHSAYTGERIDSIDPPAPGEGYQNISVADLWDRVRGCGLEVITLEYDRYPGDVRLLAKRP